ncbi:hypothetical protein QTP88_011242 [Uroleucon formosanum]
MLSQEISNVQPKIPPIYIKDDIDFFDFCKKIKPFTDPDGFNTKSPFTLADIIGVGIGIGVGRRNVIIGKWQNIRDAFIRSLKKKSGQGYTKNYIYSEQLKFLLKIAQKDDTESSIIEEESTEDINVEDNVSEEVISYRSSLAKKNKQKEERRNKRHAEDDLDMEIIKALKTCDTPPDEDQSFFNTILPSVQVMTEDEKYEFRISVLKLVHDIKKKRNNFNNTSFANQPRGPQYCVSSTPINFQQNVTPEYTSMSNTSETQQSCSSFFANYDLNE